MKLIYKGAVENVVFTYTSPDAQYTLYLRDNVYCVSLSVEINGVPVVSGARLVSGARVIPFASSFNFYPLLYEDRVEIYYA